MKTKKKQSKLKKYWGSLLEEIKIWFVTILANLQ